MLDGSRVTHERVLSDLQEHGKMVFRSGLKCFYEAPAIKNQSIANT